MIQVTPQMRVLIAVEAVDFRRGIDGLSRVCREVLRSDPFSGCMFVFRNKRSTSIKILVYDGQGFWLCQKRLSRGEETQRRLLAHELQLLIWNGNPQGGQVEPMWKKLPVSMDLR